MITFTDTHCHIHESDYVDGESAYKRAIDAGVTRMIVVGTEEQSSQDAVVFARSHSEAWASLGLHPHDASADLSAVDTLANILKESAEKIVAIGEIGLDYYYDNSPREQQIELLHAQLKLAVEYELPVIFHVREASSLEGRSSVWLDFWPIFDQYQGLRGVLHSFTDTEENMQEAVKRGLYIGVNGIATFAKDKQAMYASIPLENMLLETDAPYLTPVPLRGNVNEPAFVTHVAQFIANLQSINLQELSRVTEQNATHLFSI